MGGGGGVNVNGFEWSTEYCTVKEVFYMYSLFNMREEGERTGGKKGGK